MLALLLAAAVVQAPTVDDCLRQKACVKAFEHAFALTNGLFMTEVEGALPGRFFPRTLVWGMGKPANGHFLDVNCVLAGTRQKPCPEYQDEMEQRFFNAVLLQSLPTSEPKDILFNRETWETQPKGKELVEKVRRKQPKLWARLLRMVFRQ